MTRKSADQTRVYGAYAGLYAVANCATSPHQCAHIRSNGVRSARNRAEDKSAPVPPPARWSCTCRTAFPSGGRKGGVEPEGSALASATRRNHSRRCSPACRPRFRCKRAQCAVRRGQVAPPTWPPSATTVPALSALPSRYSVLRASTETVRRHYRKQHDPSDPGCYR